MPSGGEAMWQGAVAVKNKVYYAPYADLAAKRQGIVPHCQGASVKRLAQVGHYCVNSILEQNCCCGEIPMRVQMFFSASVV